MTVLGELLDWSKDRPAWQRDALRRLVIHGDVSDDDVGALTEICKSEHGLAEQPEIVPFAKEHVPEKTAGSPPVSLVSIFHHHGVNALAEDQTLRFAPSLTVVYGDNAAGKTGYIRILKSACRARGQERILGNVVSGASPLSPVVSIKYRIGTEPEPREWGGAGEDEYISRVSVFDAQCAAIYLTEKTDVAFRPFGLDLFDKLVQVCKAIRSKLQSEQRALASDALDSVLAKVPEGTAVAKLLAKVNSLTKLEAVKTLASLSAEERARLALLEKSLLDLQANDPEKLTRQLTLRAERVKTLARHLTAVETELSPDTIGAVFDVRVEVRRKNEEARRLRDATFSLGMLAGTGSEPWTTLWEAARKFSQNKAYPHQEFPVVEVGATCVLCQQDLEHAAKHRLQQFETFVASTTERELRQLREALAHMQTRLSDLQTTTVASAETLKEIHIEHEAVADAVGAALVSNEDRRKAVVLALTDNKDLDAECPAVASVAQEVRALGEQIEARVETLGASSTEETRNKLTAEAEELRARSVLALHEQTVRDEIERKKRVAAYELCINDTTTNAITQKSTSVTRTAVTRKLKKSFRKELEALNFHHVEVELKEAGGAEGVLYHKLILSRAPGVDLPKVVSEGEQRCLSIAAFFAELSTADDPSGIVFDDPVSSLDYRWRDAVAQRLVQESKTRQVVVFTHDVVFLLRLKQFAQEQNVEQRDQHVRQSSKGAGVCADELPWVAMPIRKKIGHLKNSWQAVDKLFRDGHQAAYEKDAKFLYGLLREAWERALEEVLLAGTVERFRPGVQTQHIGIIADITEEDCATLHTAMTKCSRWLAGHDQAPAARAPVPEPAELKSDIETLEHWVEVIRSRR